MTATSPLPEVQDDPGVGSGGPRHAHGPSSFWLLALGAIGVVYGDIGTSPLYAFREATNAALAGGQLTDTLVLGILSLIIWALLLIVTLKYVFVLLNADNKGEGGTLSLMALAMRGRGKFFAIIPFLGMVGAALFFGDAIITPAISILGAVEGLNVLTPAFEPYVIWISLAIIVTLFAVQSHGTSAVAGVFGPVTLLWFAVLAVAGIYNIMDAPVVLMSVNPLYAIAFLNDHGMIGLVTLGAVFLAVTGAEALYADLGHFGKNPIKYAWLVIVLPSLVLNYLGQGALVLSNPAALENPFFFMVPEWGLIPLVAIATAASIIASQAVITGAYSMARQAVQLGFLPRMSVSFTSYSSAGQIYMPQINWLLLIGVIALVLAFRSSSALATAYGIAVTGTMVVTAILAMFVIKNRWKWPMAGVLALMVPLLAIDVVFFGANALKIAHGGWLPLTLGGAVMLLMWTWRKGTRQLLASTRALQAPLNTVVRSLAKSSVQRIDGAALYLTQTPDAAPTSLMHGLKHYQSLHRHNAIVYIVMENEPTIAEDRRLRLRTLSDDFTLIEVRFGYMETPDVPRALAKADWPGASVPPMKTSYVLSRRSLQAANIGDMPAWQDKLFIFMARNADDASHYFQLPEERVLELGSRVSV
ncbi:potassium transporter Kup [Aestuariivirga sp.]|uniref:potassium transporter Kup n=1 Tax=Aestuariivirga sp. TaxID=2650926 RepID=UPI0039E64AC6